jgi:hypothetical protein
MRPALALLVTVGIAFSASGCAQQSHASGWCRLAKQQNDVFASHKSKDFKALAAFQQIAAQAPAAIRADVVTIADDAVHVAHGDSVYFTPPYISQVLTARAHVDAYLKKACGVSPPTTGQA